MNFKCIHVRNWVAGKFNYCYSFIHFVFLESTKKLFAHGTKWLFYTSWFQKHWPKMRFLYPQNEFLNWNLTAKVFRFHKFVSQKFSCFSLEFSLDVRETHIRISHLWKIISSVWTLFIVQKQLKNIKSCRSGIIMHVWPDDSRPVPDRMCNSLLIRWACQICQSEQIHLHLHLSLPTGRTESDFLLLATH